MGNCEQKPKYKREIREAIIKNVEQNKNVVSLRKLLLLTDIERRLYDDKFCSSGTEYDFAMWSITLSLTHANTQQLICIRHLIEGFLSEAKRRAKKKSPRSSNK